MRPFHRSSRLAWPSIMLAKAGEEASSKSAMNTLAPELSALTIILRSTGPVISTRRSRRSAGIGATFQSPSRIARVSIRKSGSSPASKRFCRSARARQQLMPARVEAAMQVGEEGEGRRVEDFLARAAKRRREFRLRKRARRQSWRDLERTQKARRLVPSEKRAPPPRKRAPQIR